MAQKIGTADSSLPTTATYAYSQKLELHFSSSRSRPTDIVSLLVAHWGRIETANVRLPMLDFLGQHFGVEEEGNSFLHLPKDFLSFPKL